MIKIIKFIENKNAVSEVLGYALTIGICVALLSSTAFIMNISVDNQKKEIARIEAKSLANNVADVIGEAVEVKQNIPNASFERKMELPSELGGYEYKITATNTEVTINIYSTDLEISCSLYGLINKPHISKISGEVSSGYNYLIIDLDDTNSSITPIMIIIKGGLS